MWSKHFLLEDAGLGDGAFPKMALILVKLHLGVKTSSGEGKGAQSRASPPSFSVTTHQAIWGLTRHL